MKLLVTVAAVLAVAAAAPTGKSWGVPLSLAPQRVSYNYAPAYYVPVHLQRLVAPPPAPVIVPYSSGGSSRYHIQDEYGQYQYGYVNSDGQAKTEIRGIDGSVAGKFSYYDPNGKHIELTYVADKDGFRAAGDHLPKPVELPDDLAEAYKEANERLVQTRRATAIRQAYRAQKAALAAYQTAARSYSHFRPPTVYVATYPQATQPKLVQTYAQPIPTQTRVYAVPAQSKIVQTYTQAIPQPQVFAQPRPTIVQAYPQVYAPAPVVATSSSDDGGGAEEDDDDEEHDDGKYDHEQQEKDVAEHDDGKYRQEEDEEHHDDGKYRHDDEGDDDDNDGEKEDEDQDKGDGESEGDGPKVYTGVFAAAPGQTVVATPVQTIQGVYTAQAAVPAKIPASPAVYVAQAQTRPVQASVGLVRPVVYTAPAQATVGVVRPAVYSVQAPTPFQATVPAAQPAIYSAPSQPSVSFARPVYSAQVPVQAPVGVVRSTYTSPGPAPVSYSVSQPVAPPSGSPVIATKVKTYTSTGTVGSPYASYGGAAGTANRLSSYSVSAQIPVSSVPVATPQVTVPVYSGVAHTAGAAHGLTGYKTHPASGPLGSIQLAGANVPAAHAFQRATFSTAPQAAAAPAGQHVKSGYTYPG